MTDLTDLFDSIQPESVTGKVVNRIEAMILDGALPELSRLPSERVLAERMGVSRPKLREALKILAARELISIRHGDGTYVEKLTSEAMSPGLINLYARHGLAFRDYLEYRREQEAFAATLAAERATQSDREVIADLVEALETAHRDGDMDRSTHVDVQFHMAIVSASHNAMLIHMMRSIYDLTERGVFYNRRYLRAIDGTGDTLLEQHRRIARGVLAGDSAEAAAAARAHLDFVEHSVEAGEDYDRRERRARLRQGQRTP